MEGQGLNPPRFVDHRDGNHMAAALAHWFGVLRATGVLPSELCITTAFFNLGGWEKVASELEAMPQVRLLLGAEPRPEAERQRRIPGDLPEPAFTEQQIEEALERLRSALRREVEEEDFRPEVERQVHRLVAFLRRTSVQVRRHRRSFLHAKAWILRWPGLGVLAGSSNLTRAGLSSNKELNLGVHEGEIPGKAEEWFEWLWSDSEAYDLAALYEELLTEYAPWDVYLRMLWELYGRDLMKEEEHSGALRLATFQQHGVWRARRILERYGGVLVADGVGLGKTFVAGALMQPYLDRRQRVLLICPAVLRDGTWARFLDRFQLYVKCLSYHQLADEVQLGGARNNLENRLDEYALVVIDEAHAYRNPDALKRAGVLRRLLQGKRRDLVLLTATPVNNSLFDLYHLLTYFLKQDSALSEWGILSLKERFEEARHADPFDLNPDHLYPVVDATTVKRTRRFVKKHYAGDYLPGPDGTLQPIVFPRPVAMTVEYEFGELLPGFFARFSAALIPPENGRAELTLARYQPEHFYLDADKRPKEDTPFIGLLRSGLLKRFESSSFAFAQTCARMAQQHEDFLSLMTEGWVPRTELLQEIGATEDAEELQELVAESDKKEAAEAFDVQGLQNAVESDLALLREFQAAAESIRAASDPKVDALVGELVKIAVEAGREGVSEIDTRNLRKVLVFSSFEDTVMYLRDALEERLRTDPRLAMYRGRFGATSGGGGQGLLDADVAVWRFAPESSEPPPGRGHDDIDLLLTTDVLAEGLNLQQCRHIINYDLPWNPMRLVQRHGRVDRINSRHPKVFLRTFFPDRELDELLRLEERVRKKLAWAAASVGMEDAPVQDAPETELAFAETRAEIEKLREQDATLFEEGGTESASQTGEEYRQILRKALKDNPDPLFRRLPWKTGSGFVSSKAAGHLFCIRIGDEFTRLRFVHSDPAKPIERELATCLRLAECEPTTRRHLPEALKSAAYGAWQRARQDVWEEWDRYTDPANLQPRVPRINRLVGEFLEQAPVDGMESAELSEIVGAVMSPWPGREAGALRECFLAEYTNERTRAQAIIEFVRNTGLQPYSVMAPFPKVTTDQVQLICWLGLTSQVTMDDLT